MFSLFGLLWGVGIGVFATARRHLLFVFFLSFLLVFNHLLGSPLLIKHDLCPLRPSDGWVRIAAVHHLRQQRRLFCCSPQALMLQINTATLSPTLVSPSCYFSVQTFSFFMLLLLPNSLQHFFSIQIVISASFSRNCLFFAASVFN